MRTTVTLDDALVDEAQRLSGIVERSLLLRRALEALIEREAADRLARLGGASPIVMDSLKRLPRAAIASDDETLAFIRRHRLPGRGVGYVDAPLLASVYLVPGSRVWTRDKRLAAAADSLGVSAEVDEAQT